jgi:hypothetical protein
MVGLPSRSKEDREEIRDRRREEARQQRDEQTARSLAQGAATQQGTAAPGYWEVIGNADIEDPSWGDNIEGFVKGELSRAFALGNITRKEFENMELRIENEFWQVKNEMRGPDTSLSDDDMRMLYGEERATLDDARARRLRSAREIKKQKTSLSVDARGLRSGTEIHAVARTEDADGDGEGGGLFAGLGKYLGR